MEFFEIINTINENNLEDDFARLCIMVDKMSYWTDPEEVSLNMIEPLEESLNKFNINYEIKDDDWIKISSELMKLIVSYNEAHKLIKA